VNRFLLAVLSLSALAGCNKGPSTTIPLVWKNPNYAAGSFKKLFVIGVGEDDSARRLFEDTFARAIAAEGAAAQASWGDLPKSEQLSEEEVRAAIEGGDFDGVLITRVLGVNQSQEYVPPSTHTVPTSYYGYGYYGYYGASYAVVHEPGYYKTNTTFRLETNLYSVATGDLVWSGQSDTLNPESLKDVIDSMTAAVAKKLKNEGLIP
jgi:basic membrane lipoprotein Med (substrate-binding protein (PBP1-ABC) superfamily)